jgi:hypothetical protein
MAPFERAYQLAPWNALASGWLAAALWRSGEKARARQLIMEMGESPLPLWGRVVYHPPNVGSRRCGGLVPAHDRTPRSVRPCVRESVECPALARASPLARTRGAHEAASHGITNVIAVRGLLESGLGRQMLSPAEGPASHVMRLVLEIRHLSTTNTLLDDNR